MPHVRGHVQNSKKRIGQPFKHKGGVLFPIHKGSKLDFPIMFFLGDPATPTLTFGHKIAFHPILLEFGASKYLIAGNVCDHDKHEDAERVVIEYLRTNPGTPTVPNPTPEMDAIEKVAPSARQAIADQCADLELKNILNQDIEYLKSNHYKKIYFNSTTRRDEDTVVQWIYDNTIAFEEMNLATN